jgi:hypothetical protein
MLMDGSSRPIGNKNVVGNKLTGADVSCGHNQMPSETPSTPKNYGLSTHESGSINSSVRLDLDPERVEVLGIRSEDRFVVDV